MPLNTGQTLHNGRYRIVKLIGQGGFGAVYRAWDLTLKQPVALKENLEIGQEAQRQFEREATLMASLRHPNLPRVIDHFIIPGQGQYLVMDFVEGQNLEDLLAQQGRPFTEQEIMPWFEQVCGALAYLHSLTPPIIHRDIKPQNIIITPASQAILVDFGISKIYDANSRTTIGAKAVTPGYSPPEQYGGGVTDSRADIYSLGSTLYFLLTNNHPPESVLRVAGNTPLTPPRQLNTCISSSMEQAILRATDVSTSRRFQSIAELQQSLKVEPRSPRRYMVAAPVLLLLIVALLLGGRSFLSGNQARENEAVETAVVILPPAVATGTATSAPTPTPTAEATSTAAAAALSEASPTETATPETDPTTSSTATRTPMSSRTPTRPSLSATPTNPPTRQSVSAGTGLPLDFVNFGAWARGDEPNGTFVRSGEQSRSGGASGKLSYDFGTTGNDYVVFMQTNEIPGTPNALQLWVYGDGSGHFLNAWIIDAGGQTWQVPFGQVFHTGWRQMTGYIVTGQRWPWTHISGPNNDEVDYPIRFRAFVLDDYTDSYIGQGVIYLDDLTATTVANPGGVPSPAVPTATPGGVGVATPTNTPVASPTSGSSVAPGNLGRILYTSGTIILTTDPDWTGASEVGTAATNTCSNTAGTVTGQTFNLYRGPYCPVGGNISTCRSPNGQHEVLLYPVDAQTTAINIRPAGSTENGNFVYQGVLDQSEGIRWSPLSNSFLFVVGDTVHRAFPDGSYNQIIPIAYEPLFSPDGSLILFRKPIGPGVNDIFVSNVDGSNARNVTNIQTIDKRCAVWRQ